MVRLILRFHSDRARWIDCVNPGVHWCSDCQGASQSYLFILSISFIRTLFAAMEGQSILLKDLQWSQLNEVEEAYLREL